MKKTVQCNQCGVNLEKDWLALNRKLINPDVLFFLCLGCLADYFDCETDDLLIKIEEFKEQGCTLF